MTDGRAFDNTNYVYISKLNDYVFLQEKQSNANIILYNENIKYLKIKNEDLKKSILLSTINLVKEIVAKDLSKQGVWGKLIGKMIGINITTTNGR